LVLKRNFLNGKDKFMRIMGIDYGDRRIGIAISDLFGWTAQGIETIDRSFGISKVMDRIRQLVKEYNIEKIVVGFPYNMNGTIGPRSEKTQEFIEKLSKELDGLEIIKWDERLTTVAAQRTMHEIGVKTSRKKDVVDQIAASYILQNYLDSLMNK
jgi:putative Holliday junction resolvase